GLDEVAGTLVTTVNDLHRAGYALDGTTTGLDFFDPTATTARTIKLDDALRDHPELIAASEVAIPGGTLDGGLAERIALLSSSASGADARYRALIGQLGVESQATQRRADMQASVYTQVAEAAVSVRGVSLDEELANLVVSQQAYAASARVLTAIDEMLETLISRTGHVGR